MFDFLYNLNGFEMSAVTMIVGVLVSVVIGRLCNASPAGIMGGALLLLAATASIYWAAMLLVIAVAIVKLYALFIRRRPRGHGSREPKFIMVAMAIVLSTIGGLILQHLHVLPLSSLSFPLGMIFPATAASVIRKQGVLVTYKHLALAVVLTLEIVVVTYAVGRWLNYDFHVLDRLAEPRQTLILSWSALFALFSVFIGYLLYRRYEVKAIGFITLPLMATMVIVSPTNFLLLALTAIIVYFMTQLIRRYSLVTGTERYAFTILSSIMLVWVITYFLLHQSDDFSPYMGTGLFAALASSVMVNEHSLYGVRRAFPLLVTSLGLMILIQISGSFILNKVSSDSNSLRYYIVRQATAPDGRQQ